jgi:hypothetical protein
MQRRMARVAAFLEQALVSLFARLNLEKNGRLVGLMFAKVCT